LLYLCGKFYNMEGKLEFRHLLFCYNNLKKIRKWDNNFEVGKHLGYLEAGLVAYGYLETVKVGERYQVKTITIPSNKWWRKDKVETYEQAIIRMTEKMFNENNIIYG